MSGGGRGREEAWGYDDLHALVDVEATGYGKTHGEEHRSALVGGVEVDAARDWSMSVGWFRLELGWDL